MSHTIKFNPTAKFHKTNRRCSEGKSCSYCRNKRLIKHTRAVHKGRDELKNDSIYESNAEVDLWHDSFDDFELPYVADYSNGY